jgi:hypothetical protein
MSAVVRGAKAMHDYLAAAIRDQAGQHPHPFSTRLAGQPGIAWEDMRPDQREDWMQMFRAGLDAADHRKEGP